jgi:hypothetical protein
VVYFGIDKVDHFPPGGLLLSMVAIGVVAGFFTAKWARVWLPKTQAAWEAL